MLIKLLLGVNGNFSLKIVNSELASLDLQDALCWNSAL